MSRAMQQDGPWGQETSVPHFYLPGLDGQRSQEGKVCSLGVVEPGNKGLAVKEDLGRWEGDGEVGTP